jgi:hypothetical protein
MKRHLILASILALSAICCSKHNDPPPPMKGYFREKVDGVFFSDTTSASISQVTAPRQGPMATVITGQYGSGVITLSLPPFVTIGERLLDSNSIEAVKIARFTGEYFYAGSSGFNGIRGQGSGKIHILEITGGYMKGTFECIAPVDSTMPFILPPVFITEGEFKLKSPY